MHGKQLPIRLQGRPDPASEQGFLKMKPYTIHMIALHSFKKTADGYCYLPSDYYHTDPTKNIFQKDIKIVNDYNKEIIFIPLTAFDGYNVLMLDQISHKALEEFSKIQLDERFVKAEVDIPRNRNYPS